MADIAFTKPDKGPFYQVYKWASIGNSDAALPVKIDRAAYAVMVQVDGTFGGTSVAIHGSLDGVTYGALASHANTALAVTSAGMASVRDPVLYIKPVLTGGSGSSVNVLIMVREQV